MKTEKIRVIKDFEKLSEELQEQIKLVYPHGFSKYLITFTDKEGNLVSALPFETDEKYYLVRMTRVEAKEIINLDEDYDEDGELKDETREEYEDKYSDLDYLSDHIDENDNE
ncbi:MAG: hypothetical protein JSV24_02750 [Bacteroidales bacterium]|nr:MAG: hypothetical protein JSV24_02750 [Bacteroidales bacterium]